MESYLNEEYYNNFVSLMKKALSSSLIPEIALVLVIVAVIFVFSAALQTPVVKEGEPSQLKKFSSEDELRTYLNSSRERMGQPGVVSGLGQMVEFGAAVPDVYNQVAAKAASESMEYSATNIQVEGVDEADFVKNDGKYIYTINGNKIIIVDAYPAEELRVLAEINFTNSTPSKIFINGNRLVVFGSLHSDGGVYPIVKGGSVAESIRYPYYHASKTFINIYDISDRSNPVLSYNYTIDGYYSNSRMIGDYVYLLTNQPVYSYENPVIPTAAYRCGGGRCFDVWYFDSPDYNHQFTIISSVNIMNPGELNSKVFLMGYTQNLYVSRDNIYVSYSKYLSIYDLLDKFAEAIKAGLPSDFQKQINEIQSSSLFSNYEKMSAMSRVIYNYSSSLPPEQRLEFQKKIEKRIMSVYEEISKDMEKTIVHKIAVKDGSIEYKVQGDVPGYVLNQFSMDEHNSYFRIATTTNDYWQTESKNHLYVLDSDLKIIGKVEDLAPGERIYSVRFIGDRAYMVTFRQIDPLFVIDLSIPSEPRILGFLKITGVSDYLHPYDENHIIGVGRDATEEGRIVGMKLSLFDVSDVQNPKEISKYLIGKQGTYSEALNDHKAFLFSRNKNILTIPVSETLDKNYWNRWEGAYVFNIDTENGFVLKGRVTHLNETELSSNISDYYYYDYNAKIRRSLYIDNVIYTVSGRMTKANDLSNMAEIKSVEFPVEETYYYPNLY